MLSQASNGPARCFVRCEAFHALVVQQAEDDIADFLLAAARNPGNPDDFSSRFSS